MIVRLIQGIEAFSVFIGWIGAWVMAPLIVSMVYEVLARHLFNAPTFWAYEIGYMLAGTCYLFGMAYCMKRKGHVRVDFLYDRVGPKWRAIIDIFGYCVLLLPGALWVTWGLYEFAVEAYVSGEVSGEIGLEPHRLAVPHDLGHRLHRAVPPDDRRNPEVLPRSLWIRRRGIC